MKRIVTVIGARPQFIKAAAVSRALAAEGLDEALVHTGQHFDREMSEVFFDELGIPEPRHHLGLGGGSHGAMTGRMLERIEAILLDERPDLLLVYGDTNSTLAGALAASKLHIPVAHVEAGLRSFNRAMPEEINRVVTDHIADLLFCPSEESVRLLAAEGITEGVEIIGDVMRDAFDFAAGLAGAGEAWPAALGDDWRGRRFALMTLHRAENTDARARLASIVEAIGAVEVPVVLPLHPRTVAALEREGLRLPDNVVVLPPVTYLQMSALLVASAFVLTDSGGLQKEAYWAGRPCVTLRDETEWVETVAAGWNTTTGADRDAIVRAVAAIGEPPAERPPLYGEPGASARVAGRLAAFLESRPAPRVA